MRFIIVLTAMALLAGCSGADTSNYAPNRLSNEKPASSHAALPLAKNPVSNDANELRSVIVYTLSNGPGHNKVLSFVARDGALKYDQAFDTDGLGDPSVAGTVQGAIAMSDDNRFLFAVDAGSNEISSFRVEADGLQLIGKVASGGMVPVSLTVHRNMLFVLNEGSSSISGFRITRSGKLRAIRHSSAPLSGDNVGPAEISFDGSGHVLVVTEKSTNDIDTYSVTNGVPTGPTVHASSGETPFGFAFVPRSGIMVVSEAFGGASGLGAASSYSVTPPNTLAPISVSVPDHNTRRVGSLSHAMER